MKHLLLMDAKAAKQILFLYYLGILLLTLFIHPILGWAAIFFIIRIEQDVCKENALMGLPQFYKDLPNKNLYPDEKNAFFYIVLIVAILIWGGSSFIVGIEGTRNLNERVQIIIILSIICMIVCGFYHMSWIYYFLKYQNITVCMQMVRKYYIIFAVIFLLLARSGYAKKFAVMFYGLGISLFLILFLVCFGEVLFSIYFLRKSYETDETRV